MVSEYEGPKPTKQFGCCTKSPRKVIGNDKKCSLNMVDGPANANYMAPSTPLQPTLSTTAIITIAHFTGLTCEFIISFCPANGCTQINGCQRMCSHIPAFAPAVIGDKYQAGAQYTTHMPISLCASRSL